jgi:biopolymer transport protein ExbD
MAFKTLNGFFERETATSFNMTPVIDIVFLLIVFFALVFKFIEAENFPVAVPAGCDYAQSEVEATATTVSVLKSEGEMSDFAVGANKAAGADYEEITENLTRLIDSRLKETSGESKVVTLRIDRDVPYAEVQYALAALAKSSASDVRLAVMKDDEMKNKQP